jgi:hypothetical protein
MWDFVVDKVALGQVFSEYFGFPCQSSFHQLLQKSSSSIIWDLYNRPKWPQYQGLRYLGTQSHPTNNNNNHNTECRYGGLALFIFFLTVLPIAGLGCCIPFRQQQQQQK